MSTKYRVAIIGASGYTGGELIRLITLHPQMEVAYYYSQQYAGQSVASVHSDLFYLSDHLFTDSFNTDVDGVFLAVSHGAAKTFLEAHPIPAELPVVDLSRDFRLQRFGNDAFVYGLPEAFRSVIQTARRVANPGCFATAIQLALLPLVQERLLKAPVHIHAITGSSGAGKALSETTHFTWRHANVSIYQPFQHPHLAEIQETLRFFQSGSIPPLYFIPMRGNFTRGIYATLYTETSLSTTEAQNLFEQFYEHEPFVHVVNTVPSVKQVVNTNHALIYVTVAQNQLLVVSTIDNLLKGAAGQAVQNMNLMLGLPETSGLYLKSIGY